MRTFILTLLMSAVMSVGLRLTAPIPPTTAASITSLTLPSDVFVGERIAVHGSVLLSAPEELVRRFHFCGPENSFCTITGWTQLDTVGHWVGLVGIPTALRTGVYQATWTLYAPWAGDSNRAAKRVVLEIRSHAIPY